MCSARSYYAWPTWLVPRRRAESRGRVRSAAYFCHIKSSWPSLITHTCSIRLVPSSRGVSLLIVADPLIERVFRDTSLFGFYLGAFPL